jgi:hypothetical protein
MSPNQTWNVLSLYSWEDGESQKSALPTSAISNLPSGAPGTLIESAFPMRRESIAFSVRGARSSAGCFSIISSGSCLFMSDDSRRSMGISGRSSEKLRSATSIAAIPARALPGSAVRTAMRNTSLCFRTEPAVSARRVTPRGLRTGASGVQETLLLDAPHRQVVLTIPKTLRIFFKFRRRFLGELCPQGGSLPAVLTSQ